MFRLFLSVLRPVKKVLYLFGNIEDIYLVLEAQEASDVLDAIFCSLSCHEDDISDHHSNLVVDNIVCNQVDDMDDVFGLCWFGFQYLSVCHGSTPFVAYSKSE